MNNYILDLAMTEEVFDNILSIDPSEVELIRLRDLIEKRYNHAYLPGVTEIDAANNLAAFIQHTSIKFIPMLKMYDNELNDLLELTSTVSKDTTSSRTQGTVETPSSDSTLTKDNETPDAGNIDLTTDTYISHSTRTSVTIGERESNVTEAGTGVEQLTSKDRLQALTTIGDIKNLVHDLYGDWLKLIDINCFTYVFD